MDIGTAIMVLRKTQGLTQKDLAKKASITQTALSQIENGRRPSVQTFSNLCKAMETPEPFIHLMTLEEKDVHPSKRETYRLLMPVINNIIKLIVIA